MKITIIGAGGCVGSSTAYTIALQGLADEIIMIGGRQQTLLKQHALDIDNVAAVQDITVKAGSYEDMTGSDIVINAAGVQQEVDLTPEEKTGRNLAIVKEFTGKIEEYCPGAIVITATNPIGNINYGTYLMSSSRDRRKFIGFALNDSIRFRKMLSRSLGRETSQIDGTVIGDHGPAQVLLFSSVRVDGRPFQVSEDIRKEILEQIPDIFPNLDNLRRETGRTAGWTTAAGLAVMCRAIVEDTGEMIPCSAVLDGEYGYRGLSMTVPLTLGREGIREFQEWELSPDERARLENSMEKLKAGMRHVEEYVGKD